MEVKHTPETETPNTPITEKALDKSIAFIQKQLIKARKIGDKKGEMQCYQSLEIAREQKRNLSL